MQYHSFTRIWVFIAFLFHPFKASFYLSKENGLFSLLPPSAIAFSVKLIYFLIIHKWDHSFRLRLPLAIQSQDFVFSPFGGWQGGSSPWGGQNQIRMQNRQPLIIDRSSPGGGSRGVVLHKWSNIYAPPQNRPISGDSKHMLTLKGDTATLARAPMPKWSLIGGGGVCCAVFRTHTLQHGESNNPPKTNLSITCWTSSTCAAQR